MNKTIGIFGGTFNPVHQGHLTMAQELKQHLGLDEMRLVPACLPPHRDEPEVSSEQRLAMLKLALEDYPELLVDTRELQREGLSYTVDTLQSLRDEFPDAILVLCMGMDSLLNFSQWHRWQDILSLAHLAVATRPESDLRSANEEIKTLLTESRAPVAAFQKQKQGLVVIERLTLLPVSSTQVRQKIQQGLNPENLIDTKVFNYIKEQKLYCNVNN